MLASTCLIAITLIGFQPGPADAFRANKASIRARVDYEYRAGYAGNDFGAGDVLWTNPRPNFVADPKKSLSGQWDSDGRVDRYEIHPDPEEWSKREKPIIGVRTQALSPVPMEFLFDGNTFAHHVFALYPGSKDPSVVNVLNQREPGIIDYGLGPFHWFGLFPFHEVLATRFPGINPERKMVTRGGYPTEVEAYQIPQPDNGSYRLQICYDPSIGYLPRYTRGVSHFHGNTFVTENFIVEAKACKEGGFVPMEWYGLFYDIKNFDRNYPQYTDETPLLRGRGTVLVGHFIVKKMEDRVDPIALEHIQMIRAVAGETFVPLKETPKTLTLDQIKQILGPSKSSMSSVLPPLTVDESERKLYLTRQGTSSTSWGPILGGSVAFLAAVLISICFYRAGKKGSGLAVLFLCSLTLSGCSGHIEPPVVIRASLEGSFHQDLLVYPAKASWLPVTLKVQNSGNVKLRVDKVEGGCSCRKVDISKLPILLEPGESIDLPVELKDRRIMGSQRHPFSVTTDRGQLNVSGTLITLADHSVAPDAPSNNSLVDGTPWRFELVHRSIFPAEEKPVRTRLVAPPGFDIVKLNETQGSPLGYFELKAVDTRYEITLSNQDLGAFKENFRIEDDSRKSLLDIPVAWQRLPFLSTSPSSILIGQNQVRVFLRCPDLSVELVRVTSQPVGIKAVVTSPREISVRLADDAPGVISGHIEVETTDKSRSGLRIPVVRYAPPISSPSVSSSSP